MIDTKEMKPEAGVQLSMEKEGAGSLWMKASAQGGSAALRLDEAASSAWRNARYMSAMVSHSLHDVLVLIFTFRDALGREVSVHFGVLPEVPTRLCLPLQALEGGRLFLDRYPGVLQSVMRGDASVDRTRLSGVLISTPPSTAEREFLLTAWTLGMEEPVFEYEADECARQPLIDSLGQWTGREWVGKTRSRAEMTARLREERAAGPCGGAGAGSGSGAMTSRVREERAAGGVLCGGAEAGPEFVAGTIAEMPREERAATGVPRGEAGPEPGSGEYGRYGGWKGLQFAATGYFRTEQADGRWWFADPEGYALFSAGMDCVGPSSPMHVRGMKHLLPALPAPEDGYGDAWRRDGAEFCPATANLITAFGASWREDWQVLTERRLYSLGINTVGNWSDPQFIASSSLPYVLPLQGFPETQETIFRDFPDVFHPEYAEAAERFARQLESLREDRRLVGYFMRNEPQWAFVDSLNLTGEMLKRPARYASKERLVAWLQEKYGDVAALNAAWNSRYADWEELYQPQKASVGGGESPAWAADCDQFNRMMIRRYVEVPARCCKEIDPHHLNLGMRYAWVASDAVLEGCEWFDVFSLNSYQWKPDRRHMAGISARLGRPVMIGEFHFGSADAGLPAYGIKAVATGAERGGAYRYYVEQAAAIPELIGVHYFQWNDQPLLGRFDGENYQIGAVDVCSRLYPELAEAMREAHSAMYEVRTGVRQPYGREPVEIPKTGF
ncbi:beta-galactosidase [Paenibacillus tengchongensis]|uniref:beta-galactosidase n=1 Tax=Paenibacillus tengchongensis TaxID=2608684 RepID=UPI001652296D|nr:beta-galactosidase [Paenibacillus tengchongensis]